MKIGIACYPTFGGSGMVASELALALAARGHAVHVMSYARPPRLSGPDARASTVRFHEVRVREYPLFEYPPYSLALATKMVEVVRDFDLEVMHVHYAVPNAISAILARQILAPRRLVVVTTLHGTDVTLVGNDPSYLETTRFSLHQSDAITAVSSWLKERTLEQLGESLPIVVVPNFVDGQRFASGHAPRSAESGGPFRLVHVSNFRSVKRPQDLIEVLRRLLDRGLDCELVLVGEGPELAPTLAGAARAGATDRVRALGELNQVEDQLRIADLFLLPSEQESFGLAALEAMAAGVPVIATRTGGLPEVVPEGAGLLFSVGDVAGMAQGAERLLRDPALHRRFAERARAHALEFTLAAAVERYEVVYERALRQQLAPC